MTAAETTNTPRGIESAFSALAEVRNALMLVRGGRVTILESLPDAEFMRVTREVRGARISRDEVVFIEPDPDYFRASPRHEAPMPTEPSFEPSKPRIRRLFSRPMSSSKRTTAAARDSAASLSWTRIRLGQSSSARIRIVTLHEQRLKPTVC